MAAREQNLSDLELRPAANSMLFNQPAKLSNNTNMIMTNNRPNSGNDLNISSINSNMSSKSQIPISAPLLKESLPIKQVSTEKPKQAKNKVSFLDFLTS